MGEAKDLEKFCLNLCSQFSLATTTQTTLLDIVDVDLSFQGIY